MSSKRHQRNNQCTGKVRFDNAHAASASASYATEQNGWAMNFYECQFCKGFHIGHNKRFKRQLRRGQIVNGV